MNINITPLSKIREALKKMENKKTERDHYPFWNMKDGDYCVIRFLPDADETNTFFWRERQIIKIPFRGTKEDPNKSVVVQVPCIDMYGKARCPIMEEISPWFKDPDKEELARVYWKKRSYIFQGFVVVDPLNEKTENPIRKLLINPSIFKIIKSSLMDPDIEDSPVDFEKGRDFRLEKTKKGSYSDYSTSKWSMKIRPLTPYELDAIETYGLYRLCDLLPKEPTEKELEIIYEMFQASLNDELYDFEKWGNYYRPNIYGYEDDDLTEIVRSESQKPQMTLSNERTTDVSSWENERESSSEEINDSVNMVLNKIKEIRTNAMKNESTQNDLKSEEIQQTSNQSKKPDALAILESLKRSRKQ